MVSLADLRARNVLPTWQEAVAVAQELVQSVQAATGTSDRLPDPEHVALISSGDVVAVPGSLRPDNPVRHLAILLKLLTDGVPMPEQLGALIEANLAEPTQHATVEAFSEALAFFERPGRRADIERLVARAADAAAVTRADEELQRLKARALEAAERAAPPHEEEAPAAGTRSLRLPLALAAVALVIFGLSGGYYVWATFAQRAATDGAVVAPGEQGGSPDATSAEGPYGSLLDRARERVASVVQAARESVGASPAPKTDAPPTATEPEAAAAPRRARRVAAPPRPDAPAMPAAADPAPMPPQVNAAIDALNAAAATPASAASSVSQADRVYSALDFDVLPPLMVRPMMPADPPANVPPDRVGILEVLVDEYGNVERVKLAPASNRYQERMFVAHVKSWRFQPAMRDGQPVKYQLRLRLTI
jgi:periplasmic protein TonB